MINYLYLILSTFCAGVKGYASKRVSGIITKPSVNAKFNALRSFLCCVIAFVLLFFQKDIMHINAGLFGTSVAAVSGVATAVFLMSWLSAVREGAYMMVGAFGNASFVVPLLGGISILGEQISLRKILAVLMIIAAILLMCSYNNKIKTKLTPRALVYLFLVMLMQGASQFLQKLFMACSEKPDAGVYSFYTFLFSGLALVIFAAVFKKGEDKNKDKNENSALPRKSYIYVVIMAVALFAATYLQTLAAKTMDAAIMYPLVNVFSMLANVFMSVVLFHERLRIESVVGTVLVLGAVLLYL